MRVKPCASFPVVYQHEMSPAARRSEVSLSSGSTPDDKAVQLVKKNSGKAAVPLLGAASFNQEALNPMRAANRPGRLAPLPSMALRQAQAVAEAYEVVPIGDAAPYQGLNDSVHGSERPSVSRISGAFVDDEALYRQNMAAMIGYKSSLFIWGPDHPFRLAVAACVRAVDRDLPTCLLIFGFDK